jgi:hypothetical protein
LTPNEQYAALIEVAGYVPVPLGSDDYIELLPTTWRVVNSCGIKISHRTYDTKALNPYRRWHSGITASNGKWEVHYDPYDVTRVWIRNHIDGGWITAPWTHLLTTPVPFGDQAWGQAQQILARRGENPATETEIAGAVATLLDKAEQARPGFRETAVDAGPPGRGPHPRHHRIHLAAAGGGSPADDPDAPLNDPDDRDLPEEQPVPLRLAPVIPVGIFDAREEAKKWW